MTDAVKGGLGKKGASLKAAAQRWQALVKADGNGDGAGLKKEWKKVDASGNGTISQSEVLTWLATSFSDLNDTLVVQYAFHAALSLQTKTEPLLRRDLSGSRAPPPSSSASSVPRASKPPASSRSLTVQFFPPLLSNVVAASRAVVLFRLWDAGGATGDKRLQRKEWEAGVKGLKRTALSRDALAAEWTALDADGKGAALFGEFCGWFRWALVHLALLRLLPPPGVCLTASFLQGEGCAGLVCEGRSARFLRGPSSVGLCQHCDGRWCH